MAAAAREDEAAKVEEKSSDEVKEKKSPMEDKPYEMLSVAQRVGILCALCESLVDDEHVRQGAIVSSEKRKKGWGENSRRLNDVYFEVYVLFCAFACVLP